MYSTDAIMFNTHTRRNSLPGFLNNTICETMVPPNPSKNVSVAILASNGIAFAPGSLVTRQWSIANDMEHKKMNQRMGEIIKMGSRLFISLGFKCD